MNGNSNYVGIACYNAKCLKSHFGEVTLMFQGNATFFMIQCLGHVKCTLNMVYSNLNNFCSRSSSFCAGSWL